MEHDIKIVAGLGAVDDYEVLVNAGADELFCGFVPNSWNKKYGNLLPLNRREVLFYHVNIGTYEDMRILKKKVDAFQVPVSVAINALYYTDEQIEDILQVMEQLLEIGFDSYIVADWHLAMQIQKRELPCNIHMSGEVGEWNSNTISFFSQFLRIERIIFHRKNRIEDMEKCVEMSQKAGFAKSYEAFFMNELCHYTGGFCNSLHCDEMVHICQLPYELKENRHQNESCTGENSETGETQIIGESGCGLCALWDLYHAGIRYLKVVGRGKGADSLSDDIRRVVLARSFLVQSKTREMYVANVKKCIFPGNCSNNCYYRQ